MRYRMYFHETTSVAQKCYDRTIRLHSVFPKPVRRLTIQHHDSTYPNTMPYENEPSREINAKVNPPVATLKRVMSRRHRVIGFSLQVSLYPFLCPSCPSPTSLSFSFSSPARVVFGAMHAEDPGEPASLVRIFQTPRCFLRRGQKQKIRNGGMRGEPRRRGASRYGAGRDGKTGGGWMMFGCL